MCFLSIRHIFYIIIFFFVFFFFFFQAEDGIRDTSVTGVQTCALPILTHQIPPGDVRAGQYVLARVWHRFPEGTVHLVVVDPGVGTSRRALAAQAAGHYFVAPDNGVLSPLPADARFFELPVPLGAAPSFHGRDLFAPAAAELATGTALAHLGSPIAAPYRVPLPAPHFDGTAVRCQASYADPFDTL